MDSFKDHFSEVASGYVAFRPGYPPELGDYLANLVSSKNRAWDAGCGSGQLSVLLANRFDQVIATDASAEQLRQAKPHPHIVYKQAKAEDSGIEAGSVDLATAAQAAHWFDLPAYYAEVRRVVKKGGFIALICYPLTEVAEPVNSVLNRYYRDTLKNYWPPERKMIEDGYQSLPFPFEEIKTPNIAMKYEWNYAQLIGYLETWSATRALQRSAEADKWPVFMKEMAEAWGDLTKKYPMQGPSSLRVGRV